MVTLGHFTDVEKHLKTIQTQIREQAWEICSHRVQGLDTVVKLLGAFWYSEAHQTHNKANKKDPLTSYSYKHYTEFERK